MMKYFLTMILCMAAHVQATDLINMSSSDAETTAEQDSPTCTRDCKGCSKPKCGGCKK